MAEPDLTPATEFLLEIASRDRERLQQEGEAAVAALAEQSDKLRAALEGRSDIRELEESLKEALACGRGGNAIRRLFEPHRETLEAAVTEAALSAEHVAAVVCRMLRVDPSRWEPGEFFAGGLGPYRQLVEY